MEGCIQTHPVESRRRKHSKIVRVKRLVVVAGVCTWRTTNRHTCIASRHVAAKIAWLRSRGATEESIQRKCACVGLHDLTNGIRRLECIRCRSKSSSRQRRGADSHLHPQGRIVRDSRHATGIKRHAECSRRRGSQGGRSRALCSPPRCDIKQANRY